MRISVGISARHVHLTKENIDILFGKEYSLTKLRDLSQTGQYACEEKVTIKTAKGAIDNVRILGPIRGYTQVEISKTDSYLLGINPPVRNSGDLKGSESVTIIGPKAEIIAPESCIIATRHIHANEQDLMNYNLKDKEIVKIKVEGEKGGILDNVIVKTNPDFKFELHIDLDDANAHLIKQGDLLEILKEENNE
jgi:propanediol utilization protein